MFREIWCELAHDRFHVWYGTIRLCKKCDKGGGKRVQVLQLVQVKYNV